MIRKVSRSLLLLVALVSIMAFVCQAQPVLTHHMRDVVRNGQAPLVGHLPATQSLRLVVSLPLRNEDALDRFLEDVQDPYNSSYHQYLTVEEFTAQYGPTHKDYETVIRWAESHGLSVVGLSRNRVNIDVKGQVSNIEKAFHVSIGVYQHPTENRTFYAVDREPSPDNLSVQLFHVEGLDNFSVPRTALVRRPEGANPLAVTGSCPQASFCGSDMRAAYYGGTKLTGAGQTLGLLEYLGTDLKDLTTYYTNAKQTNNVPITLVSTDGTSTSCVFPSCDDTEQTLDMTQALGMAPGLTGLYMYVGSTDTALLNGMATANPLNFNLSSSWYWNPADPNTDSPYFKEFSAQGQTYFEAAGDGQDWQRSGSIWPSDSQYVVGVGGTDLTTSGAGGPWASEIAWIDGGGGHSPNNIPIPSWQTTAAAGCGDCSQTLRNGPDVSANSNFTFYVCADQQPCSANLYGGTSFAAPMWAGFIALANSIQKKPVGFIDPALYRLGLGAAYGRDFHDITSGTNGYPATTGYDLATGWGSPKIGFLP
jgi:kumamolisin